MIKAIITDFDGTLVDTYEANLKAYQKAFCECGKVLTPEAYKACFGLRYDAFMYQMGIIDIEIANFIRERKKRYYPLFFDCICLNHALLGVIDAFHKTGGKTAIASTARKENLMNVVKYLEIEGNFDCIISGLDVIQGKPQPEIYVKTMKHLCVMPSETLIFEDSDVGIQAAKASGANYIRVTSEWFR